MEIQSSKRIDKVHPSSTLLVATKARALKMAGKPVIDLGVGEPDFDTPIHIKAAAIKAINEGFTKYTPVDGILPLRQAIVAKFQIDNGLTYEADQIIISNGGKQCFFNMAEAYLNPDDEVIIPAPYWVSYPEMVLLAEAKPVFISTTMEDQFKITAEQLEKTITPNTRLFVINSPSNPTGQVYTREELSALAEVLIQHPNILIASDDMYEQILWEGGSFCNIVMANKALYDRTIILHGVSKTYAMTGWRIGYAAGPKNLIKGMIKVQSQSTSGACSISQMAALAAITGDQDCVTDMVKAFKERHDYLVKALNDIPGFEFAPTQGSFYAFVRVQKAIDKLPNIHNDLEFSEILLNEAYVATVPGSGFGTPGYLRISLASSLENLQEAVGRMIKLLI